MHTILRRFLDWQFSEQVARAVPRHRRAGACDRRAEATTQENLERVHPTSIDTNTTMLQTTAEAVKGVTVRRKYVM
jgi:hypothetical protein